MTSLFYFEDKVHRKSLIRVESTPLLFPILLCKVLEHIGFLAKPRLERRHDCKAILTVDRWRTRPHTFHLPPPEPAEDQPVANLPTEEQLPLVEHTEELQANASSIPTPATTTPFPTTSASSPPLEPPASSITTPADVARPSISASPPQHITISTRDFLAIMDAVHAFSVTSTSFAAAHTALAERMTRTEAALAQNQAILMKIQSHLGLPPISTSVPAQASSVHPPIFPAPSAQPTPTDSLHMLVAAIVAATPPAAHQPAQDEDDVPQH